MAKYMPATSRPGRRSSAESWLECVRVVQADARRQGGAPFGGMLFIHSHLSFLHNTVRGSFGVKLSFLHDTRGSFFLTLFFGKAGTVKVEDLLGRAVRSDKRASPSALGSVRPPGPLTSVLSTHPMALTPWPALCTQLTKSAATRLVGCAAAAAEGCSKRPGGPRQCCMPAILRARRSCESPADVVCILGGALAGGGMQRTGNTLITARVERRHAAPCATAQVARGQRQCLVGWDESNQVCCNASCGTCGGPGCSKRPGGQHQCCMPEILRSGHACRGQEEGACILHRATPEKELPVGQLGAIRAASLQTLRFSLAFTSVEQMIQERGCGAMPTEAMLVRCRELASPSPSWRQHGWPLNAGRRGRRVSNLGAGL